MFPANGTRRRSRFRRSRRHTADNGVSIDDLIDFTPELRAEALKSCREYKIGPIFTPPVVSKVEGPLATLDAGTGKRRHELAGRRPTIPRLTSTLCVQPAMPVSQPLGLVPPPTRRFSDVNYVLGTAGQEGAGHARVLARSPARTAAPAAAPEQAPALACGRVRRR